MGDYMTIPEAVAEASRATGFQYTQVPGKKIMYEGVMKNGGRIILCTPQARRQPQGFFWTDITMVQVKLLNSYDRAEVVFRLEGGRLTFVSWVTLSPYLTTDCMKNNSSEGDHWKLYIYDDRIKIVGSDRDIPLVSAKKGENLWKNRFS